MRRTASEVLHELEVRIARLERNSSLFDYQPPHIREKREKLTKKYKGNYNNDAYYAKTPTAPSPSERRKNPENIEYAEELASSIKKKLERAGYRVEHYRDWHENAVVSNPLGIDFPNSSMSDMEALISHMARTTGIGKGNFKKGAGYLTYSMVFHNKKDPSSASFARAFVTGGVELTLRVDEVEGASFYVTIR